ncbi:MAG: thiamine-phosphate kinase [Candidatus Omnitrophota bacterium]
MTRINVLGEFGLINKLTKKIKLDKTVFKGVGDDAAVLNFSKNKYLLVTSDMLIEDVHFLKDVKPFYIGYKALACSISDIAAMGGLPRYAVISIGLPPNLELKFVQDIYKGILSLASKFKINIVGGDTNKSDKIIIDVSLMGFVEKNNLVLRSGAKKGDSIFVSGTLGGSIYGKHLKFIPRIKESRWLVINSKPTSMIDISDGLVSDLGHILEQSKVGAVIYEKLLPINKKAKSLNEVLYMGEDYELLFTAEPKSAKKLIKSKSNFTEIGKVVDESRGLSLIDKNCREVKLNPHKGFRHF